MATTMEVSTTTSNNIQQLFETLKSQKNLLTNCTDIYKTLISTFISLQNSINSKTLTLESTQNSINSSYLKSLSDLNTRENSIPTRFETLSSETESKKRFGIDEFRSRVDTSGTVEVVLRSYCRRMDHRSLMEFVIGRKKEIVALKEEMGGALSECVDPIRMVLETVKEYVEAKAKVERMVDMRWACGVIVTGFFPPEKLKKKRNVVEFSRKMVVEAEAVLRDWRERCEKGGEKMGSAETAMYLQVVIGFGLMRIVEKEFYERAAMEFSARRDMAMLAIPIFGDKLPDFIDELIKSGKEVEAVYFASEAGLTERFQPVSLLKSFLQTSKIKHAEFLKKVNNNADAGAINEANAFELSYIRPIIKCVEDHKLEKEFPIGTLRKRLSSLEKAKFEKKMSSKASSRPSKRARSSGVPSRSSGGPPPRPGKRTKYPGPRSPVSRYLSPYASSGQTAYDTAFTASTYGQRYGAPVVQSADHITQQYYGVSGGSASGPSAVPQPSSYVVPPGSAPNPSASPRLGNSYGLQSAYGIYNYGATKSTNTKSTYEPPSYEPRPYEPPPYAP